MSEQSNGRRQRPEFAFEVNGQTYTIRFGIVALAELMDHFQVPTLDGLIKRLADLGNQDLRALGAVLQAGLAYHHPGMTAGQALRLADDLGMESLVKVLNEGFVAAVPAQEATEKAGPRKPGPSTRWRTPSGS